MRREETLKKFGAKGGDVDLLMEYNSLKFDHSSFEKGSLFPMAEELSVRSWRRYVKEAKEKGYVATLKEKIVQLNFPIKKGISKNQKYIMGVTEGEFKVNNDLELDGIEFDISDTPIGGVPTIIAGNRSTFEHIIRAVAHKNEPVHIPPSMGAATFSGYNNWERINGYRSAFLERGFNDYEWGAEFQKLVKKKELYQDSFIVLSRGPYSSVSNRTLGLDKGSWLDISLEIRRYHELTHHFTKRVLGSMNNNILDEIICDYVGMVSAVDDFVLDWFLRFLGLEDFPTYREGGRLQNYVGDMPKAPFSVLQKLAYEAILKIKLFHELAFDANPFQMALAISYFRLDELAVIDPQKLVTKLKEVKKRWKIK